MKSFALSLLFSVAVFQTGLHLACAQPKVFVRDVVVKNSVPTLNATEKQDDTELSIAINPADPSEVVITGFAMNLNLNPAAPPPTAADFSEQWPAAAPLWRSTDGGVTWTKHASIPRPDNRNVGGVNIHTRGPFDQTIDFDHTGTLFGAFLSPDGNIYAGGTPDPSDVTAWRWDLAAGNARIVNIGSLGAGVDQPWLLVTRNNVVAGQDDLYVAYDDFTRGVPTPMAVGVARGTVFPPTFTVDNPAKRPGTANQAGLVNPMNPGHRLAVDPRNGWVYSIHQDSLGFGLDGSLNVDYRLNRSTDGGVNWTLTDNAGVGGATGIVVANANSSQSQPKLGSRRLLLGGFTGGVNALLGGIDHATVDGRNGDLFYVYGKRQVLPVLGGILPWLSADRLAIRRITQGGVGAIIGAEHFILPLGLRNPRQAIPSVAVANDGTVGVFYYSHEGSETKMFGNPPQPRQFPIFTAHLAISRDAGDTFTDTPLLTFTCIKPAVNANPRQRELGDYMQLKTVGRTFYGAFTGNGTSLGRRPAALTPRTHDAIFFRFSVNGPALLVETKRNFGEVCGEIRFTRLILHNAGDANLRVTDVSRVAGNNRIDVLPGSNPIPTPLVPLIIPAGESRFFNVRVRPNAIVAGATTTINVTTANDPDVPGGITPVVYRFDNSPPAIRIVPDPLAFGAVPPGPNMLNLTVNNDGPCPLHVRRIISSSGYFVPQVGRLVVPGNGSRVVPVRFAPALPGAKVATITFLSDDPAAPPGGTVVTVTGNTGALPPPVLPPIIATLGTVEYGWAPLAAVNFGGPIFGSTFWTPGGQVLLGPGGGLQNLGLGFDVFRWIGPLPFQTRWIGPPPFGAGVTTIGALPGGSIVFPPPTFVQDFNLDGRASISVARGWGLFHNPVPVVLTAGGLAIGARGFLPFGAQGAVAAACKINGNPFVVPPVVIAVGSPGPFQFTGYTLPPSNPFPPPFTIAQQPVFVLGNVGGVPGYFFNAWVVTRVPVLLGEFFTVEVTYTLISDPGMDLTLDDTLVPPDLMPGLGGSVGSSNALPSFTRVPLRISRAPTNRVRISWPPLQGVNLQETLSLANPFWQPVNALAAISNGEAFVNLPVVNTSNRFYRLASASTSTGGSLGLFRTDFISGDYVVTGVGMQAAGVGGVASRTLIVTNLPSGAQVPGAYLYWATFGDGSQGTFAGNPITGTPLGTNAVACSTLGPITVYRADVSSVFATNGNGAFTVALPDSGSISATPSTLGASLVLIYQRADLPPKSVSLYDGVSVIDATNKTFFLNIENFGQVAAGASGARLTHIVGNGTLPLHDRLFFNGSQVGVPDNAFSSAQGARWDNPTLDVSSLAHSGDTAATTAAQLTTPPDCLVWGGVVYSVNVASNFQQRVIGTNLLLTAFAGAHGSVSPTGVLTNPPGSSQIFSAIPDPNYAVDQWLLDGSIAQSGGATFGLSNLQSDHVVFVTFRPANTVADVSVDIRAVPEAATVTNDLTYSIVISNAGPAQATAVNLNDPLPAGVSLVSATSSQGTCQTNSGSVQCNLGTLASGSNATVTVVVIPTSEGTITNSVNVTANEPDTDLSNNSATSVADALAPPTITLQPVSQNVNGGTMVTFAVTATGSAPLTYQWFVADVVALPDATNAMLVLSNVSSADAGDYSVVVSNAVGQAISDPATLTVLPSYLITTMAETNGTINPAGTVTNFAGETRTFTATPAGGFVVHTWLLDGDVVQLGGTSFGVTNLNSDHTATVTFRGAGPQADVVVRSYAFADREEEAESASAADETNPLEVSAELPVGEKVEFRIEVTNVGPDNSTGVQIHFLVPSGFQFVSADRPQYNSGTGVWSLVALGGIGTTEALSVIAQATLAGDYTASAQTQNADQPDPVTSNNTGVVRVIVTP